MGECKICGEKTVARGLCRHHYDKVYRPVWYGYNKEKTIRDNKQRNRQKRISQLKMIGGVCQLCGAKFDYDKKRGVFISDGKVLCPDCWYKHKRLTVFSREYRCCFNCGTTTGKHAGHGLCQKCYGLYRRGKIELLK